MTAACFSRWAGTDWLSLGRSREEGLRLGCEETDWITKWVHDRHPSTFLSLLDLVPVRQVVRKTCCCSYHLFDTILHPCTSVRPSLPGLVWAEQKHKLVQAGNLHFWEPGACLSSRCDDTERRWEMVSQDGESWRSAGQKLSQGLLQASKLLIWFYVACLVFAWLLWLEALLVSVLKYEQEACR